MLTNFLKDRARTEPTGDASTDEACKLSAAIAERDAAIERLEQTISEQIVQIETLEQALEQAKFQAGVLEQSYSTQLRDAREHAATAERSMAETQTWIQDLEAGHTELNKKLAEANAKLDLFGSDSVSIDQLLESSSMPEEPARPHGSDEMIDEPIERQTTEEMLAPDVMIADKGK